MRPVIGFLGAGNMASALLLGLSRGDDFALYASDPNAERLRAIAERHGARTTSDNLQLVAESDVLVLSVKPQIFAPVCKQIAPALRPEQLVISVAAGVPLAALQAMLPKGTRVVRSMPNTPATVLAGATAIAAGAHATEHDMQLARRLFASVGQVVKLDESALDAVTGLSGSGPAYVMLIIEALADGGVKVGLPRDVALLLAAQTVYGSAKWLLQTGEHPGRLKDLVTSPGGTTSAGLYALESGSLRRTLIDAVEAAALRAEALGAQFTRDE